MSERAREIPCVCACVRLRKKVLTKGNSLFCGRYESFLSQRRMFNGRGRDQFWNANLSQPRLDRNSYRFSAWIVLLDPCLGVSVSFILTLKAVENP